ncbi:MAG TPA: SDR family NAD(P)-dependent oxidoreductase [Isosphaeraceae bacterium]|jgi:3-oxoacyl-[acyl-carrier protein] reductase|nr:SDR family NAD(P)-dependent oxidoreductase [Isosphaeraceae bacterium]
MCELTGKIALVTGASRGIGRAIAVALARAGCDVAINYREREDDAAETARLVEAAGRQTLLALADVTIPDQVARMAEVVARELGHVEVLINSAGQSKPLRLDTITIEDFDAAVSANLRSAFLVTQAVLPKMRAGRWGRLVFISSVAAQLGGVVGPHYAASKAGLSGMAHAYAALLATEGITANVIAPALIDTEMVRNNPRANPSLIPLGRFGRPEEVADAVVMVAANGYVTGQTINVNGGWYMS